VDDFVDQSVLLVSSIRWPVIAKLSVAFLRNGCKVQVVCPPDHPFAFVSGLSKIYPYRGLDSLRSLYEAITAAEPDFVIPCDDGVVWQLHELHRTKPELRALIERSLGAPSSYKTVASRAELMQVASELNIRAPETKKIATAADLREWFSVPGASGVLKLDWTCGGKGVRVVRSLAEAEEALGAMRQPANVMAVLGRWLLIHDALAIWKWRNQGQPSLTLQQFVAGRPANTMLACHKGKVLAMVTVEVLCAQSSTGTSLVVRQIENDEIRTAAELIAERLQLSGFHGLDFMIEDRTGYAYLIELNPRCTQLGHLQIPIQGDLVGVFCRAFSNTRSPRNERPICQETIAFFPEALLSNPKCPYLETSYIDVPWEEPRLVVELMRGDWRDRGLLARLYRAMRPPKQTAVAFDAMAALEAQMVEVPEVAPQHNWRAERTMARTTDRSI
jgi:ATP-grasp domain